MSGSGLNISSRWNIYEYVVSFQSEGNSGLSLVHLCLGIGGLSVGSSQAIFQESLRNLHVFWGSSVVGMPIKLVLEASCCIYVQHSVLDGNCKCKMCLSPLTPLVSIPPAVAWPCSTSCLHSSMVFR